MLIGIHGSIAATVKLIYKLVLREHRKKYGISSYNQASSTKYEVQSDKLLVTIVYIFTDLSSHSRPLIL